MIIDGGYRSNWIPVETYSEKKKKNTFKRILILYLHLTNGKP